MALKERTSNIIFATGMGIVMSIAVSFAMIAINIDFSFYFVIALARSLVTGLVIAIPTSLITVSILQKYLSKSVDGRLMGEEK
jgi:hypothetical protein